MEKVALDEVVRILLDQQGPLEKMILFGVYARGNTDEYSDPASHNPCCNSTSVRSGCSPGLPGRNRASTSAVTQLGEPCRCSTRSICPVRRRCQEIFRAQA